MREVTALDAAAEGLAEIEKTGSVETVHRRKHELPFADNSIDHIISWNVIYHGDEDILLRTISEILRCLKPGGTYLGTMQSKRRLPHEHAKYPSNEIGRNSWIFDAPCIDKIHPHYFCSAAEFLALFSSFEVLNTKNWVSVTGI